MSPQVSFCPYQAGDQPACLALFDANCPAYFDPDERAGYVRFLESSPDGYEICLDGTRMVGAYGLRPHAPDELVLRWILIAPAVQGRGIGSAMMGRALDICRATGARLLHIAASHKSAPFFARFGAVATATVRHGWGPDLDRVDMQMVP